MRQQSEPTCATVARESAQISVPAWRSSCEAKRFEVIVSLSSTSGLRTEVSCAWFRCSRMRPGPRARRTSALSPPCNCIPCRSLYQPWCSQDEGRGCRRCLVLVQCPPRSKVDDVEAREEGSAGNQGTTVLRGQTSSLEAFLCLAITVLRISFSLIPYHRIFGRPFGCTCVCWVHLRT